MSATKISKSKPKKLKQKPKQSKQEINSKLTPLSSFKTTATLSNTNTNGNTNENTTPPTSPQSVQSADTSSSSSASSTSRSSTSDPKPIFTNTTSFQTQQQQSKTQLHANPNPHPHPLKSVFLLKYPVKNFIFTTNKNEIKGEFEIELLQDIHNVTGIDIGFSGDVVIRCNEYRFTTATPGSSALTSQCFHYDIAKQIAFVEAGLFDWRKGIQDDGLVIGHVDDNYEDDEDDEEEEDDDDDDGETKKEVSYCGDCILKSKEDQDSDGDESRLGDVELLEKMKSYDGFKCVDADHHKSETGSISIGDDKKTKTKTKTETNNNNNYDGIDTPATIVNENEDPMRSSPAAATDTKSTGVEPNVKYYSDTHKPDNENTPFEKTKQGVTFKKGTVLKYPFQFNIQSINGADLPTSCHEFGERSGETGLVNVSYYVYVKFMYRKMITDGLESDDEYGVNPGDVRSRDSGHDDGHGEEGDAYYDTYFKSLCPVLFQGKCTLDEKLKRSRDGGFFIERSSFVFKSKLKQYIPLIDDADDRSNNVSNTDNNHDQFEQSYQHRQSVITNGTDTNFQPKMVRNNSITTPHRHTWFVRQIWNPKYKKTNMSRLVRNVELKLALKIPRYVNLHESLFNFPLTIETGSVHGHESDYFVESPDGESKLSTLLGYFKVEKIEMRLLHRLNINVTGTEYWSRVETTLFHRDFSDGSLDSTSTGGGRRKSFVSSIANSSFGRRNSLGVNKRVSVVSGVDENQKNSEEDEDGYEDEDDRDADDHKPSFDLANFTYKSSNNTYIWDTSLGELLTTFTSPSTPSLNSNSNSTTADEPKLSDPTQSLLSQLQKPVMVDCGYPFMFSVNNLLLLELTLSNGHRVTDKAFKKHKFKFTGNVVLDCDFDEFAFKVGEMSDLGDIDERLFRDDESVVGESDGVFRKERDDVRYSSTKV
ncbi:unnamed protein product [Ambrosiozyma monospora]|uniref:Unnamed protein product n=1 Tax=Ambrosiozyma monospora TaxID=43982 RepID=A0A9W6Z155_AMBMO|nr:unnamed protein product [Ambrosiozyma monospora]